MFISKLCWKAASGKAGDLGGCLAKKLWRETSAGATQRLGPDGEVVNISSGRIGSGCCGVTQDLRVNPRLNSVCSAGLQAGTLDSRKCPPEGGRYIIQVSKCTTKLLACLRSRCFTGRLRSGHFQARQKCKSVFALDGAEVLYGKAQAVQSIDDGGDCPVREVRSEDEMAR